MRITLAWLWTLFSCFELEKFAFSPKIGFNKGKWTLGVIFGEMAKSPLG
jgi:hypothetical protein